MKLLRLFSWLVLMSGSLHPVFAVDTIREQEISECRSEEIAVWPDGKDRPAVASQLDFIVHPAGTPYWFELKEVESMVERAASAWSACGIPARVYVFPARNALAAGVIQIRWDEKESRGNFALANLTQRTLSLSPAAFTLLRQRNPRHDARQTLQMVISHEMGHFYGLMAHSRRCVDVLSYYQNEKGESCFSRDPAGRQKLPEYRHTLPTACDIERCRRANRLN